MKEFLLVLRDHEGKWEQFSPEELQRVIDRFNNWNRTLREEERFVAAGKLTPQLGRTVRARGGELVVDGPFSEAKEAIAGFYWVRAASYEEASAVAKGCPIVTYGGSVEVREMSNGMCEG